MSYKMRFCVEVDPMETYSREEVEVYLNQILKEARNRMLFRSMEIVEFS